ncbi:alpha/beta hydrolase [Pedobacter hartonius]|uniref:Esterase/lipase n=1 Tax=Pedobacter hartonius TaxID=425514 RepID=A0A1H4DYG1_9SPHI|nr:alpha/beta hydrolase [Pedobacter hartonius]SEA77617.1 Esterase/lipase [Pedobacter hartonius]
MKIIYKILAAVIIIPPFIYFLGPSPKTPVYGITLPKVPELKHLDNYVKIKESKLPLKPENNARIIWADQDKKQTEYAVVYLHGFSASHEEGNPAHVDFAKKYHCNLYLSRLAEHGMRSREPMLNFTAEKLWNSALEAYAIGRKLGKKVIIMSTSTGGTLSLKLASEFPDINSLILYSPNIEINNKNSWLLNNPWGLQLARKLQGSNYVTSEVKIPQYVRFWYPRYRLEAAVQLEELTETTMVKETFEKIKQPVLLLYYYKDEQHQDNVVKVDAMLKMFAELGTPAGLKRKAAIPNAGNHVIGSAMRSGDVPLVEKETDKFANEILKISLVTHN